MLEVNYREIGRNIRKYRRAKRLKQRELAQRINVSEQHVSHIENAHTQLSLPTLLAIADALEVDCNTLLGKAQGRAERSAFAQEVLDILDEVAEDEGRVRLCLKLCRMVARSEIER